MGASRGGDPCRSSHFMAAWLTPPFQASPHTQSAAGSHHHSKPLPTLYCRLADSFHSLPPSLPPSPHRLLEAAGYRDDDGDYYKIPGNSSVAWRGRVRDAIRQALTQLETEVGLHRVSQWVDRRVGPWVGGWAA